MFQQNEAICTPSKQGTCGEITLEARMNHAALLALMLRDMLHCCVVIELSQMSTRQRKKDLIPSYVAHCTSDNIFTKK